MSKPSRVSIAQGSMGMMRLKHHARLITVEGHTDGASNLQTGPDSPDALFDTDGRVTLESGRPFARHAPLLVDVLGSQQCGTPNFKSS